MIIMMIIPLLHKAVTYIDKNSELFLTITNELDEIDEFVKINNNEVIYNKIKPFFIHGPSGTYLDKLIIKLGYNYNYKNKIKDDVYKDFSQKRYGQIVNYLYQNKKLIYTMIFIIILLIIFYIKRKNRK
jgi:hypothetical protein